MKPLHVLMLCVATFAGYAAKGDDTVAQSAPAQDSTDVAAAAGTCNITGYRSVAKATTPAYVPGEATRQSELGARLTFPVAALGYDPATQRFTVALNPQEVAKDGHEVGAKLVELRRKHVEFEGDSCPGQTESGGSVRCFEATTLASRGSNPVYCQKDQTKTPE